jgi:ABC-type sugar transport system permease subunit
MLKKSTIKLSLSTKRSLFGYIFVSPFVIGFIFLFLSPLIFYITLSFSKFEPTNTGIAVDFVGIGNYQKALTVEIGYVQSVIQSILNTIYVCPAILLYSFFVSNILNQKFKGRTFARAIFFLPMIIATGIATQMISGGLISTAFSVIGAGNADMDNKTIVKVITKLFGDYLENTGISDYIVNLIGQIYTIAISSGVQILIFLAALQNIPSSLYEASSIEGATAWENFWKITLPMISPMIIVSTVYTVVDLLVSTTNPVMDFINNKALKSLNFCYASSMGLMYFIIILLFLGVVIFILNKSVFYENR